MNAKNRDNYIKNKARIRASQRAYYLIHREKIKEYRRVYNQATREARLARLRDAQVALDEYKTSRGCSSCGYSRCGAALDFHHVDPAEKERRIVASQWTLQPPALVAEIAKCVLLCANCHREVHLTKGDKS